MGSVHLLKASDYPLPAALERAYSEADTLLMEIDLDDLSTITAQWVIQHRATPERGQTLKQLLGDDKYSEAQSLARTADIDLSRYSRSEPWHAALEITREAMSSAGFEAGRGIDQYFASRAITDGKRIDGLETFEQQIAFFDELPLDLQTRLLLQSLAELETYDGQLSSLVTAWRDGNLEQLATELNQSFADYPLLRNVLVTQRNQNWVSAIESLTTRETTSLVVVGALHLVGEDSLLALLAERGLKAHQIISD